MNGELFIKLPLHKFLRVLFFLKMHSQSQYKILADICAIAYPWKKNSFEIFYNLLSITYNSRITLIISTNEQTFVQSITKLYPVAGWFEREIWDMFGIYFINNLSVIST